jgi:N6-adenosine-specific RNA methylase IME4
MNKKYQIIVSDPPWSFSDKLTMSDTKRGSESNYGEMLNEDIINLDIKSLADPNGCLLALWVPSSLLQVGMDAIKAYGFQQKQSYVWVKTKKEPFAEQFKDIYKHFKSLQDVWSWANLSGTIVKQALDSLSLSNMLAFGMGRLFRQTHEICLIGINNTKIYQHLVNKSQRSVSFAPNLKHSSKPEHLQDSLELMFPELIFPEEDRSNEPVNKLELFARRQRPGWDCIGNQVLPTMGEDIRVSISNLLKNGG